VGKKQHDLFKTVYILAHPVCPLLLSHKMALIFLNHNRDSGMPAEEQNLLRTCAGCGAGPRVKFHVAAHTGMVYSSLLEEQKQHTHIQNHSPPWFTLENKQWYHQAELGCQLYLQVQHSGFLADWQIKKGSLTWFRIVKLLRYMQGCTTTNKRRNNVKHGILDVR